MRASLLAAALLCGCVNPYAQTASRVGLITALAAERLDALEAGRARLPLAEQALAAGPTRDALRSFALIPRAGRRDAFNGHPDLLAVAEAPTELRRGRYAALLAQDAVAADEEAVLLMLRELALLGAGSELCQVILARPPPRRLADRRAAFELLPEGATDEAARAALRLADARLLRWPRLRARLEALCATLPFSEIRRLGDPLVALILEAEAGGVEARAELAAWLGRQQDDQQDGQQDDEVEASITESLLRRSDPELTLVADVIVRAGSALCDAEAPPGLRAARLRLLGRACRLEASPAAAALGARFAALALSESGYLRQAALEACGELGGEACLNALEAWHDAWLQPEWRLVAARALSRAASAPRARALLRAQLDDGSAQVRLAALAGLLRCPQTSEPRALAELAFFEAEDDEAPALRAAVRVLRDAPSPREGALVARRYVERPPSEPGFRAEVGALLALAGPPEAFAAALRWLADEEAETWLRRLEGEPRRRAVAACLGARRPETRGMGLSLALEDERLFELSERVAIAARELRDGEDASAGRRCAQVLGDALSAGALDSATAGEATAALLEGFELHPSPVARAACLEALCAQPRQLALPILRGALEDRSFSVRRRALAELAELGGADDVVPMLRVGAAHRADEGAARAAVIALISRLDERERALGERARANLRASGLTPQLIETILSAFDAPSGERAP